MSAAESDAYIQGIREFNKLCDSVMKTYAFAGAQIPLLDAETQDILHDVELSDRKSRTEAAQLCRDLRRVRQMRRAMKDAESALKPFNDWCVENRHVCGALAKVQGQMKKIADTQRTRIYTPRIRKVEGANAEKGTKAE